MSTRVDLDDELVERLRTVAKSRGISLREYIQELLQECVSREASLIPTREVYKQKTFDLGAHLETPWAVLVDLETEEYTKLLGKK